MSSPKITLDQWRALVAVVDAGGYAQAASLLHRTQSTISYAVQRIEEGLEVSLFTIAGRKAVLTPVGQVLYRRGRALVAEAERLERTAAELAAGREPVLRLAIEVIFPTWLLLRCLEAFAEEQPQTRIELYESVLGGTDELLQEGRVDLALASQMPPGFVGDPVMHTRFIAVAAPTHPLHQLGRDITLQDLREHRHLVVRDSGAKRTRAGAIDVADQRWTVSHKATSIRAVCMGLGFAWFAEEMIRDELVAGDLKPLPLRQGAERWGTLYLIYADEDAAGPGLLRLAALIRKAAATCAVRISHQSDTQ